MGGKIVSFGEAIKQVISHYTPAGNIILEIRQVWQECVGKTSAKHSLPVGYMNEQLSVYVDDSHWLAELKLYEQEILEKLTSRIPHPVKSISWKLVVSLPKEPKTSQKKLEKQEFQDKKLSQETLAMIEESVGKLEDEDLRKAMRNFLIKIFFAQEATKNQGQKEKWR
ncbi:DUF721 domain-containing protein [Thermospira aquatica]|uniref:DUF721 domain-containing protein n=1 Tax=Thermospira aquatica TaxID=2828656 RepID=A0AAX3BB09_9SPIR|nr:DUF721 domain-containing protein [Thermospira aquatica]URA09445.1 DUF721 domain-containing protein [Thermospira aquatica]